MVFKKCCCCIDLRVGAIIIGILQILGAIGQFWNGIIGIIGAIAMLVAGICLLVGALKYNQVPTLINLIFAMIVIVLDIVMGILFLVAGAAFLAADANTVAVTVGSHEDPDLVKTVAVATSFAMGIACFIGSLIHLYLWVCVLSFWKELKSGKITSPV